MAKPTGRDKLPRFAAAVARGAHLALLKDALDALDRAERQGVPFADARTSIAAKLRTSWTVGDAPRTALTADNAVREAMQLGRMVTLSSPDAVKRRPFWLFSAVLDDQVTETCLECDGTCLPAGHAWWATHTPQLHQRCRSDVLACTAEQAKQVGITAHPPTVEVEDGFGRPGDLCDWEPRPGDYPAELFDLIPMRDATTPRRMDLGVSEVHVPAIGTKRRLGDGYEGIDFTPPAGAREEAQRGLDWRREHGRGGTAVGVARARDLARGAKLSPSTVRRMVSFFARHAVDKQGTGWSPGEDGYPSNGRIAWALWGGDAGRAWAAKVAKQMDARKATDTTRKRITMAALPTSKRNALPGAKKAKLRPLPAREPAPAKRTRLRRRGLHLQIGLAMDGSHRIEVMHAKQPTDGAAFLCRCEGVPFDMTAALAAWSAVATAERSLATAADADKQAIEAKLITLRAEADKPVWIQLAKVGSWKGHPAGPFEMTPETFAEIERNFRATVNQRIPIDFEHASEADASSGSIPAEGAPAQGWIVNLDNRGNNGLWGLVQWLEPARTYIREGKYRFFSPAVRFGSRDRVTGKPIGARMTSGALTNIPFLDGLVPVAAADRTTGDRPMLNSPLMSHDFMARMRAALRCGDTDTMEKLAAKCADLRELCMTADDAMMSQGVDLKPYMTDLAGLMNMPAHSTLGDILEAVEEMIEAAIARHEATYHPDGGEQAAEDPESMSTPTPATAPMNDAAKNTDLAVTLGETKAALSLANAEKATLMSERDAAVANGATLSLRLNEATTKLTAAEAEKATLTAEVVALKAEIAKRDNDALDSRVTEAFETYKTARNLTDAHRKSMVLTLKHEPATFEELYPRVAPGQRHLLQNLTGGRMPTSQTTQMSGKVPAGAMPITNVTVVESPEQTAAMSAEQVAALTDRLMSEKGMSLKNASIKAGAIAAGREKSPFAN